MLRELGSTRQIPGEPRRRWFLGKDLDLVVWFDDADAPCAFQLAYDKDWNEHSLTWHWQRGYRHYVVSGPGSIPGWAGTPLLYADGPLDRDRVLARFIADSADMPARIVRFVEGKLRAFNGPLATSTRVAASP